jgi:SOS response regulatory protein OraA/RecX
MKRKPLTYSWKTWCLYKLAVRDYSTHEMKQMMLKRASESDQEVDPIPVVNQLVEEGALDNERYLKNQLAMATNGQHIKGPREIRHRLSVKGGISDALIDSCFHETDQIWFQLAEKAISQTLAARGYETSGSKEIPIKLHNSLKQKLHRKGFTREQVDHAMVNLVPISEKAEPIPPDNLEKRVAKQSLSGKGPKAILYDLKYKGAEESEIQSALDKLDIDWIEQAKDQIQRKYGASKKLTFKDKRKRFDFLARKGYTHEQIRVALEESS